MIAINLGSAVQTLAVVLPAPPARTRWGSDGGHPPRPRNAMFAGGSEAAIVPIAMAGLNVMTAVSTRNDDPQRASDPFDLNRDGL